MNPDRNPEKQGRAAEVQIATDSEDNGQADDATHLTVEELLQEREAYLKLQETNRRKIVFLASAAHELKTPLAVIKGYHELLLTGSLGYLSEKQKEILEDLRDCLEQTARRLSGALQRKGVKLETLLDPSIATFRFDYQKVQQAAENLLDNALKHTPSGGTVTLGARPQFWERRVAEVDPAEERRSFCLRRPNSVEVSVTDSGGGIAPEHHQEIFEEFVRLDRNTPGMGLGLPIAKWFIQAHGGKIWVKSEGSRGSTFVFLLPMDQN